MSLDKGSAEKLQGCIGRSFAGSLCPGPLVHKELYDVLGM